MSKIIIAIDGFSSCGKSTLAKDVARALHYAYVDTGAMYRAVTLYLLQQPIDIGDTAAVKAALPHIRIHFENVNHANHTFLNDTDVEAVIRLPEVSNHVSQVAAISEVRRAMVQQQQAMGERRGVVMDGRDIGTVVFKDAELKIFVTADIATRTRRRVEELAAKGYAVPFAEVQANLLHRDHIDSTREDSPLRQAPDAIVLDNTHLSREEQAAQVLALAHERIQAAGAGITL